MLDLHALHDQLQDFGQYRADERRRQRDRLARARAALADCAPAWEALRDRVHALAPRMLTAGLCERPDGRFGACERPTPVTVVATDGSQIYPERHREPACYLLNIGCVALQYGTGEAPHIVAYPELRYRARDMAWLEAEEAGVAFDITTDVVSALRDEQELERLFHTALEHRRPGRFLLAMADGTLIRWMIQALKNPKLEALLLGRYLEVLNQFYEEGIPVCSYISQPGNTELVNLLRCHCGETDDTPPERSLRGLLDRDLMAATLDVGERSALFISGSRIQSEYARHRIHYFYVRLPDEVARVELPEWAAQQPGWVDTIHALVLDQAEKGGGYPSILTEAHERAVVRHHEKEIFYLVLEKAMQAQGVSIGGSRKALSKRVPRI